MDLFAVEAHQLRKQFGDFQAVRGIDLAIQRGEVFSLLGPNGAGKSTTISMLAGLLKPSAGGCCHYGPFGHARRDARPRGAGRGAAGYCALPRPQRT